MSKIIATAAIRGAYKYVKEAEERLEKILLTKGKDAKISFPNTAYYLPLIYALLGIKINTLEDAVMALKEAKALLPPLPTENLWLPYLGNTLDAGIATLIAEEIIEALKYLEGENPQDGIWLGFTDDAILRTQGIKLVDGRMPGFAAIVGACPSNAEAVKLARELQERNILVFLASSCQGVSMAEQLAEEGIEMNWDTFLVPYGKDTSAVVHALNFAARAAMTFGGIVPKGLEEARQILLYNKNRVHAFVLALGEDEGVPPEQVISDEKYATAAGAINFGFPVISNVNLPQILPTGICTYEHVVSNVPLEKIVDKAIEVRGLKIKFSKLPIPVAYGAGFEGERVRRNQMHVQFGGKYQPAFELLVTREMEEVENEKVTLYGPDIDKEEAMDEQKTMPLGFFVEVAGRKMHKDFEPVLERHIHHFLSCANGVMHTGQRDNIWTRISKEAFAKGLRLEHLGKIVAIKLKEEFPAIVDKVQVSIYTAIEKVKELLPQAQKIYKERDERVAGMSDEEVDTFFSCVLCQSYAPNHVCVISPERLGLCGAYTWLDCRAAYEINPRGANQPIKKGRGIDELRGEWEGINKFVYETSKHTIERFHHYSIMSFPESSCGCFECIVAVIPEAKGVMIVNREFSGDTPLGMSFSALAGSVGGGNQVPGFLGIGKLFISSRKFLKADGGIKRIVWMPKELKEEIRERFEKRAKEEGVPDLLEKIADETVVKNIEELISYLEKVKHPVWEMPSII
ncbi:MAG: acetyl-CoA decarbonylase/synthase complex subunit alpha/beta [Candidatus Omnitrophica bacterium]|nr:acetyl-CoA decarbonylase/synthase complex subunit alpha/beta [Candidatus Omnitrophota bacterium]MCM8793496.1 acetyl-CoA decarbonylase/synthase complex subunit alpha/beta [Candidatus Omnitrophota bacterium]